MKKNMIYIALAVLILPSLVRLLWFYRGVPDRPEIATPDYQAFTAPKPPQESSTGNAETAQTLGGTVVLDVIHGNLFQPADISTLSEQIEQRGGKMETLSDPAYLEAKLKYAKAFIIVSPTILYAADEIRVIQSFVSRGGRLLVFTDATKNMFGYDFASGNTIAYGDANVVNPILSPFGIIVNNDYLYDTTKNEGNFRNIYFDGFGKNEMTFGLSEVTFYGTHSVKTSSGLLLLRGAESTLSSINDANDPNAGGAALSENGNVAAFGDFTFMTSPYNTYADNATLISNLADFVLGGEQTVTLANFPYVFTGNQVNVFPTSEIQMTPEMITAIGSLQSSLQYLNISMGIVDKAPKDGDTIVLGTFTPSDDLEPFTDPFDFEFDEDKNTVTVNNLGKVDATGNGLVLFERDSNAATITLLADTQENLITLISTFGSSYLYGCVVQKDVAVCGVGYSDSSSDYSSGSTEDSTATEVPASENMTPTPAPAGQFKP